MRSFWLSLVVLPLLAACAEQPSATSSHAAVQAPAQKIPPQDFAPGLAEEAPADGHKVLLNDPSAPSNTPLCGTAQREANLAGSALYAQGLATTTSSCPQNACFEPLTGTFIAANGNKSVCR
ncbi:MULTISPECIES: hypothetical protein [unclassified Gluconobacter]|uniref:hypothetical protein n=1 Tax=unclassified Gluconobacter TaxID=2644261 RepID=UPI001C03A89D|nr:MULTISPECIES: hypothetical protein [unclassified Gluconobacter]